MNKNIQMLIGGKVKVVANYISPTMSTNPQNGHSTTISASQVNGSGGAAYDLSNYFFIIGKIGTINTGSFYAASGWTLTEYLASPIKLEQIDLYNGYYPNNSANYVSSFAVTVNGTTSLGSFTPTAAQLTLSSFTVSPVQLVSSVTYTFYGSYYASVQGLVLRGKTTTFR